MRDAYDIIVDYDDVLYPWSDRAHMVCERAGITNGKQITQWHMWLDYECEESLVWDALSSATVSGELYDAPMIPGTLAQLRRLRGYGHRVHIVTARGFGQHGELIEAMTREQIRNNNVPMDSLTFAKDKGEVAIELGAQFALDDGVHNYEALEAVGVMTFLMDAKHNQTAPRHYKRVHSVKEFADLITSVVWV